MYNGDTKERQYRELIRKINRAPLPDDEYGRTAAYDAFTAAYGLEAYPTPKIPRRRPRADLAVGRGGGVFSFRGGDTPSCRE